MPYTVTCDPVVRWPGPIHQHCVDPVFQQHRTLCNFSRTNHRPSHLHSQIDRNQAILKMTHDLSTCWPQPQRPYPSHGQSLVSIISLTAQLILGSAFFFAHATTSDFSSWPQEYLTMYRLHIMEVLGQSIEIGSISSYGSTVEVRRWISSGNVISGSFSEY